jgi:hypothetical protein
MTDVLFTPIRLNELEALIQNSVERAMKAHEFKQVETTEQPDQLLTKRQDKNFNCKILLKTIFYYLLKLIVNTLIV